MNHALREDGESEYMRNEKRLIDDIMKNYDKLRMPVSRARNGSMNPLKVNFEIDLIRIIGLVSKLWKINNLK